MDRKEQKKLWREKNIDKIRKYRREWYEKNKHRTNKKNKRWREKHKQQINEYAKVYFKTIGRLKANIRSRTNWALKKGIIKKQNCVECNSKKAEKHHLDYNSPLNIIWLCRKCHKQEHTKLLTGRPLDIGS